MKIILVLLDGLGDRSYEVLGNLTPLQAARTPNLDRLAGMGSNGLFHASSPGECLPSEAAHYLIFGYDPEHFPGRGLLEAVGDNVPFEDNDVLCLAHLSGITWDKGTPILRYGRDDIIGSPGEIGELFQSISIFESEGIQFDLIQTRRNDAILIMSGGASPYVSDSDPMIKGKPMARIRALENNPEPRKAGHTAAAMNHYLTHCHRLLSSKKLRANFLATQRCGRRIAQEPFKERWGLSGLLIASDSVYRGLAHELGLDYVRVKNSKHPGKDLRERIRMALDDKDHAFFHVHTKAPDEAAHKGDPKEKRDMITVLDRGLNELVRALEGEANLLVAITADHSTPSISSLIHSGEPVPLIMAGRKVRRDQMDHFDEISAARGCLGFLRGKELMQMLLNYADRSSLKGHRLGNRERSYFPGNYEPFDLIE